MIDFGRSARAFGDGDQFVDRLDQIVALVAHVADVHTAALGRGFGERDQLGRFGVESGGVDERTSDPHRPFVHGKAHGVLHGRELGGSGVDIALAERVDAHRGSADEAGDIGRDAALFQLGQILAEGAPVDVIFDVALPLGFEFGHALGIGAHRIAFAHHLERDALANVALARAILDQAFGRPAEHVDETGGDGQAGGVEGFAGGAGERRADGDDLVLHDPDITHERRPAAAIDNCPAANDEVIYRRGREAGAGREQEGERGKEATSSC